MNYLIHKQITYVKTLANRRPGYIHTHNNFSLSEISFIVETADFDEFEDIGMIGHKVVGPDSLFCDTIKTLNYAESKEGNMRKYQILKKIHHYVLGNRVITCVLRPQTRKRFGQFV